MLLKSNGSSKEFAKAAAHDRGQECLVQAFDMAGRERSVCSAGTVRLLLLKPTLLAAVNGLWSTLVVFVTHASRHSR